MKLHPSKILEPHYPEEVRKEGKEIRRKITGSEEGILY